MGLKRHGVLERVKPGEEFLLVSFRTLILSGQKTAVKTYV
jgi:hypothetical protein